MCAMRDGAPSTSGSSSGLFVTPASSSAGHGVGNPPQPRLDAGDTDDELYRCTPDLVPRPAQRSTPTALRETYLAARRARLTSQTPSPQFRQARTHARAGPFHEETSSAPSEPKSSTSRLGTERGAEEASGDQEDSNQVIPHNDKRNPFYESEDQSQDQDAPTTRRIEEHHPLRQSSPPADSEETYSRSSFPGFVQEMGDDTSDLEDTEMVDAPPGQPQARRSSREIPSSSPLSSLSSTPEIQERDWEIVQIDETRVKDGVRERKIAWKATRHSRALMRMQPGGEVVLNVAGVRWGGMREQTVEPSEVDDDGLVRVYWATTWHPDWDLPKNLVARWERKHGEDEASKEDKQQPRWWLWPEQTDECLRPEPEPDPGERELMPLTEEDTFNLEPGKDYTISFLEDRRAALLLPEPDHNIPESTIIRFLNMHVRNRLRIVDSFEEHDFRSNTLFVRTVLIYIFGTAMIRPCSHCRSGDGPFPRCVIWMSELGGACCNCAFSRRGTECEYHTTVRWFKAPRLAPDEDAMEVDDDLPSPPADPSTDPSTDLSSTPPSSSAGPDNSRPHGSRGSPSSFARDDLPAEEGQDDRSSSAAGRQHSQKNHDHNDRGVRNERGRLQVKRSRVRSDSDTSIKSEDFDASYEGRSTFHHEDCLPPPAPCRDRVCGRRIDGAQADRVFLGDFFTKGQATDEQVNFILSCCTCTNTQAFEQAWQEFRRVEERKWLLPRYETREEYFSHDCWRVLNQLIGWCPEKWKFEGEIDLTDD